ncbi:hypothetical protein [Rhodoplanes sp. SY1]|uniref:hypothetical protein n=1 Tax=Rhodoplanes sp. SY1 TaxID=3166646 RepID=UPI0038B4F7FD
MRALVRCAADLSVKLSMRRPCRPMWRRAGIAAAAILVASVVVLLLGLSGPAAARPPGLGDGGSVPRVCTGGRHWDPVQRRCVCASGAVWNAARGGCYRPAPAPPPTCSGGRRWNPSAGRCVCPPDRPYWNPKKQECFRDPSPQPPPR